MLELIVLAWLSLIFAIYFGIKALKLRYGNADKKEIRSNLTGFLISFALMLIFLFAVTNR